VSIGGIVLGVCVFVLFCAALVLVTEPRR